MQVVVEVDPRFSVLYKDWARPHPTLPRKRGRVLELESQELEARPVPREPLHQQATIRMPVDSGEISVLAAEVDEGRLARRHRYHAELDPGVFGTGKGVAVLFDLE